MLEVGVVLILDSVCYTLVRSHGGANSALQQVKGETR